MDQTQLTPLKLLPTYTGEGERRILSYYTINDQYVCIAVGDLILKGFPEISEKGANPIDLWIYCVDTNGHEQEVARDILATLPKAEADFIEDYFETYKDGEYRINKPVCYDDWDNDWDDDLDTDFIDDAGDDLGTDEDSDKDSNSEELNTIN